MEEQKYLKKKKKALNGSNKKYYAEACNELGDFYNRKGDYEKALKEYEQSSFVYSEIGMKLENAQSCRMVGEMYTLLGEFENALKQEKRYLCIVKEIKNKVEEQRALATLGRVLLLQGQSLESRQTLQSAFDSFSQSLSLCDSLQGKVSSQELMDMRARLLLNIGVVLEQLDDFDEAIEFLQKAINISKTHDLYDLHCQCYITLGLLHSSKKSDYSKAINCYNFGLDIASRLENKVEKQCEIYLLKAECLCKISDFQSAKSILHRAWKMKTPNENDRYEIEKNLKIVAAMCYAEDLLITTDSTDYFKLREMYEKMGDGSCSLKNYQKAISYYMKMLENAEKCGNTDKDLLPIYVSLYQTFRDLKEYERALEYNLKEYEIVQNNPKEAFITLMNIANNQQLAGKPFEEIKNTLLKAKEEAKKENSKKHTIKCLKSLLQLYEKMNPDENISLLENEMKSINDTDNADDSSEDDAYEESTPNIGDDICLENLTDFSDNEENADTVKCRKRGKGFTIKKNSKGETQLHQACISGNTLLVTRLVSQGHPINIRDNAGWLPIHEACIHGHESIADILIKNGALINDRGGTQCDGVTPMYDAASNGHLEVIELLLNNGALPTIKTDFGETALDALMKWRRNTKIDPEELLFYETLCGRMHKYLGNKSSFSDKIDKSNVTDKIIREKNRNEVDKKSSRNALDDNKIHNKNVSDEDSSNSPKIFFKSRKILSDSNDSSSDSESNKNVYSVVDTYKHVINAVRSNFVHKENVKDDRNNKNSKKSALLSVDEVGEDWLEDDMVNFNNKKRKSNLCSPLKPTRSKRPLLTCYDSNSQNEVIDNTEIGESLDSDTVCKKSITSNILNLCDNDEIIENITINEDDILCPQTEDRDINKSKINIKSRKWKHQVSLLKTGFSRKKTARLGIQQDNTNLNAEVGFKECSEEPDSTTDYTALLSNDRLDAFTTENIYNNPLQSSGSTNNYSSTTSQPRVPTAFKIKVEDKLLLVPAFHERNSSLTIDWLVKETCRRYYNIEGVQPSLQLLTSDGAILANEDPLSIIFGSTELRANIISWNLPPLGERYIECCTQFKSDIDTHIKSLLETSQATHKLQLSNLNLTCDDTKPLFKSLNHQTNLRSIILMNNNIGNDGLKYLAQCLLTLTNVSCINLSGNCIDSGGIYYLLSVIEKSDKCMRIQELDFSFNPISELGFNHINKLTKYLKLKYLNLRGCDIVCKNAHDAPCLYLPQVEILDISYNSFTNSTIKEMMRNNTDCIITIKMEGLNLAGEIYSQLIDEGSYYNLKEIYLSRCKLTDSNIFELLRSLDKCVNLQKLNLSYNDSMTFLSLRKLLQHPNLMSLSLEGCQNIFKHIQLSDLKLNWFSNHDKKIEEFSVTLESTTVDIELIQSSLILMWQNYWNQKASVKRNILNHLIFKVCN